MEVPFFGEMCHSASGPDVNKPRGIEAPDFETTSAFNDD